MNVVLPYPGGPVNTLPDPNPPTQPPIVTPPAATVTTTTGTPSGIYQLTPAMLDQLHQAITNSISGINKGESVSQITDGILSYLQATGQWSAAMLDLVTQGSNAAMPGGPGFIEQDNPVGVKRGDGGAALVSSIFSNIQSVIFNSVLSAPPPSGGTGSGGTGSGVGANDTTNSTIASLLALLGGNSAGQLQTTPPSSATQPSSPYYVAPVSGGGGGMNPIAIVVILAAIGLGIWWYIKKRKHHDAPAHAAAD